MAKKTDPTKTKKKKAKQKSRRHGEQFQEWRTVASGTAANAWDLPGTEVQRAALEDVIAEVEKLLAEQAVLQASKQVVSQRLRILINRGGKLSTVLRAVVKQRYGHGNDKLVEFGIKPLRSRPRPTVVPPTATPPEDGTPDHPAAPLSSE
jgi:hypothetical protein